jgi:5-methylcytosine-specific restriction endonuclease McrA
MTSQAEPKPFAYPAELYRRRHGPVYRDPKTYKPWLRDEFEFRCVFCLRREVWLDGHNSFSVEHLKPFDLAPELLCEYSNLVYSCNRCNSFKLTQWPILNPAGMPMRAIFEFMKTAPSRG